MGRSSKIRSPSGKIEIAICSKLEPERLATFAHILLTSSHAREDRSQALTAHTSTILPGPVSPPPQGIFGSSGASLPWSRWVARPLMGTSGPTPAHEPLSTPPRLCWLPPHPEGSAPRPIPVRTSPCRRPDIRSLRLIAPRPVATRHTYQPGIRSTSPRPPGPAGRPHPAHMLGPRLTATTRPSITTPARMAPPTLPTAARLRRLTPSGPDARLPPPPTDPPYGYRMSGSGYPIPARMAAAVSASARSAGSGTPRPNTCDPHIMVRAAGIRPVGPLPTCPPGYRRSAFLSSDRLPSDICPVGTSPHPRGHTRCKRSDSGGLHIRQLLVPCRDTPDYHPPVTARASHPTPVRSWASQLHPPTYYGMRWVQPRKLSPRSPLRFRLVLHLTLLVNDYECTLCTMGCDECPDRFPTHEGVTTQIPICNLYVIYM